MTTSQSTFPRLLTEIDDLTRPDHSYLTEDHACVFLGEYTARKGFAFSATNQVILNFKKPVSRRGRPEWQHKERTIREVAKAFADAIKAEWLHQATLVPMPPSKCKTDPLYDDRLVRMLQAIPSVNPLDIRELVVQPSSAASSHDADVRPTPEEIAAGYQFNEGLLHPTPTTVAIFDDVLTTGAHFVAASRIIRSRLPDAQIVGFFIARRVPEATDFSQFFLES